MEIVRWKNQNWCEIQEQDNPAFDYIEQDRKNSRANKCLLVMKVLPYESKSVGENGYVVIEVPLSGDVIRRGLFWNYENANIFADAYANAQSK